MPRAAVRSSGRTRRLSGRCGLQTRSGHSLIAAAGQGSDNQKYIGRMLSVRCAVHAIHALSPMNSMLKTAPSGPPHIQILFLACVQGSGHKRLENKAYRHPRTSARLILVAPMKGSEVMWAVNATGASSTARLMAPGGKEGSWRDSAPRTIIVP